MLEEPLPLLHGVKFLVLKMSIILYSFDTIFFDRSHKSSKVTPFYEDIAESFLHWLIKVGHSLTFLFFSGGDYFIAVTKQF